MAKTSEYLTKQDFEKGIERFEARLEQRLDPTFEKLGRQIKERLEQKLEQLEERLEKRIVKRIDDKSEPLFTAIKQDHDRMQDDITEIKSTVFRIEEIQSSYVERMDYHGQRLDNHERRIHILEKTE